MGWKVLALGISRSRDLKGYPWCQDMPGGSGAIVETQVSEAAESEVKPGAKRETVHWDLIRMSSFRKAPIKYSINTYQYISIQYTIWH